MKVKEWCSVVKQEQIGTGIYSMWLEAPAIASSAVPGQFVSLYSRDSSRLLPRPISLCEIDGDKGLLRLVYRVAGKGTEEFSELKSGDKVSVMGPLGNGFPLDQAEGKKVFLIGGGIGIPPMLETARRLKADKQILLGYRDERFLQEEFEQVGDVFAATEDGSYGTHGNVMDAIHEQGLTADVIFACGPTPMLRAVKKYAADHGIPCWISMEERMACGIGACLACVCQSRDVDAHSNVHNKRICKDGPVFEASEVEL